MRHVRGVILMSGVVNTRRFWAWAYYSITHGGELLFYNKTNSLRFSSERGVLTRCWLNAGPASYTMVQQSASIWLVGSRVRDPLWSQQNGRITAVVGSMLGQRLRRWPKVKPTSVQRLVKGWSAHVSGHARPQRDVYYHREKHRLIFLGTVNMKKPSIFTNKNIVLVNKKIRNCIRASRLSLI